MSSGLKSRVKRLENAGTVKEIGGAIVYFENEVRDKAEDGKDDILDADYYFNKDGEGNPLTSDKLEKALDGKTYITYLPIEDKHSEFVEVTTKNV